MRDDAESPLLGERWRDAFDAMRRNCADSDVQIDAHAVRVAVAAHARRIGCNESNVVSACSYGLKAGNHTLACIREGSARAVVLRERQPSAATTAASPAQ